MEMERINDNTIRVMIDNADLVERGITFLDLIGNHKQIESFFYSILEEVDIESQFQETEGITFQVLPNRDGLELFISKAALSDEDGENVGFIDFSNSPNQEEVSNYIKHRMIKESEGNSKSSGNEKKSKQSEDSLLPNKYVVTFLNFEDLIELSYNLVDSEFDSSLYYMNDQYYLTCDFSHSELLDEELENEVAKIIEFSALTNITEDMLIEYGTSIISQNVVNTIKSFFKA